MHSIHLSLSISGPPSSLHKDIQTRLCCLHINITHILKFAKARTHTYTQFTNTGFIWSRGCGYLAKEKSQKKKMEKKRSPKHSQDTCQTTQQTESDKVSTSHINISTKTGLQYNHATAMNTPCFSKSYLGISNVRVVLNYQTALHLKGSLD